MKETDIFNRLYNQETTPPSFMWDRIAKQLDEEEGISTPVVALASRPRTNWLKIAFAACFVGMVATTALWVIEKNKKKEVIVNNTQNQSPLKEGLPKTTPTLDSEKQNDIVNKEDTKTNSLPSTQPTIADPTTSNTNTIVYTDKKNPSLAQSNTTSKEKTTTTPNEKELVVSTSKTQKTDINNTNLIIKDENGNPVKNISDVNASSSSTVAGPDSKGDKAIASILTKLSLSSDKEEIDNIINESAYWKKQIQIWRNKLIKSGYAPSLINHLDLVELIKLLDEKK